MRMCIAILICRVLHFCGSIVGGFSSLPGKLALKICPDVLKKVKLCENIIAVTGSNGKTSTTELIATTLKKSGVDAVYNKEGSNQIEGVATMLLISSNLLGIVKKDVLVITFFILFTILLFQCVLFLQYLGHNIPKLRLLL